MLSIYQKIHTELKTGRTKSKDVPDAENSRRFWSDIWSTKKQHYREVRWIKKLKNENRLGNQQEAVEIRYDNVTKQCRKIPYWKAPGKDGAKGYWIKSLNSLDKITACRLNKISKVVDTLPTWMTYGRRALCQKHSTKGRELGNYRPITRLPIMWKLFTGMIAEEQYTYLERGSLLPKEQKGGRRGSRGTKDQLLIGKTVSRDCKKRHTSLAMDYDLVPDSWIIERMEMAGIEDTVINFLQKSMDQWQCSLTSSGEDLGDVEAKREILQGDSLSPSLFVLSMIPLLLALRK